ncbi:MAG: class I SAM-dependent methyltransferase [Pseudohongiella sp.]|uniref:class I SAM-dependent methyltransferase n=1 Tax=Pseudohongiella sp. TaxID=1979412 RepID=UPI0034A0805B
MTDSYHNNKPAAAADAWSTYWEKGTLHSCPGAFGANYDDEISTFWTQFFRRLPAHARVLDVGTGNGAIAFLARDVSLKTGLEFDIDGIDAAAIQPGHAAALAGISAQGVTFRSHVPVEDTGYPDSSFDAVVSQYALEYTDIQSALTEAARILRPGGLLALLMHHDQSVSAQATQVELAAFDYMADQAPLLGIAHDLVARVLASGPPPDPMIIMHDPDARVQIDRFGALRNQLFSYADANPGAAFVKDITARISGLLQQLPGIGAAPTRDSLHALEKEMNAHRTRLQAMQQACHSNHDMSRFRQRAQACGLFCQSSRELHRSGDLVGWVVIAERT